MKDLQYLFTVLYLQNSLCSIDINIPEYQYLSQRLTPEECRRLYACLHFATFDLPPALAAAEKTVPDVSCFKLLTKWDKGIRSWEGKDKSHVHVVHRLRQIGRDDLAEWLSKTVFKKLVEEVNEALETTFSNSTRKKEGKLYKDKRKIENDWTLSDSIIWAVIAGFVISVILLLGRLVTLCCKRRGMKKKEEEIMELLSYGSVDSDQETIYECVVKSRAGETSRNNE